MSLLLYKYIRMQVTTVNSPNCGHFGAQASVLYLESVLYSGGGINYVISNLCVITIKMLFDIRVSRDSIIYRLSYLYIETLEL